MRGYCRDGFQLYSDPYSHSDVCVPNSEYPPRRPRACEKLKKGIVFPLQGRFGIPGTVVYPGGYLDIYDSGCFQWICLRNSVPRYQ